MLTLEGAQAGLSWRTILYKREGTGRRSRASTRRRSPGSRRRASSGSWRIPRSCGTGSRWSRPRERPGGASSSPTGATLDELLWGFVDGSPTVNRWRELARGARRDPGVHGDVEGAEASRVPVRGTDRLLRVHAGDRSGQRSRDRPAIGIARSCPRPDRRSPADHAFPTGGPRDVRWNASGRSGGRGTRRCRQR